MSITTVRLALIEQAVARLIVSRGPRVSEQMRQSRARVQRGEAAPPALRDLAELETAARGTGLAATMAKARLRMLRGPPEGLPPVRVERQETLSADRRTETPASVPTRSTGLPPTLAGTSVGGAAIARIDALLAAYV